MIVDSNDHSNEIGRIAVCLADNFVTLVFNYCGEKNYYGYIGCLAEIIDWAHEFHAQYHNKLKDWDTFKKSSDNIYNVADRNDFIIAWGQNRVKQFFAAYEKGTMDMNRNSNKMIDYGLEPSVETDNLS